MTLEIHAIGVSAGDATLIVSRNPMSATTILIDGGIDVDTVASYLQKLGICKIDLIVATHPDYDHLEGLVQVINSPVLSISELWCFDLSILRDFFRDGTISLSKKEDHRIVYSFLTADHLLREATVKGIQAYQVSSNHSRAFGDLYIQVLYPPTQFYEYVMNEAILRRILTQKNIPLDWFPADFENLQEKEGRKIGRRERQSAAKKILAERKPVAEIPREKARNLYQESVGLGPEFSFTGESLFNEMSIVLKIEACYEDHRLSLLFPGDLSNWTYLIATKISQLSTDLWKIPHHASTRVHWDPPKAFGYSERLVVARGKLGGALTEISTFPNCLCPRVFRPEPYIGSLEEISTIISPSYFLVYPYPARKLPDADLKQMISPPSVLFTNREDENPSRLNKSRNKPRSIIIRKDDFGTQLSKSN